MLGTCYTGPAAAVRGSVLLAVGFLVFLYTRRSRGLLAGKKRISEDLPMSYVNEAEEDKKGAIFRSPVRRNGSSHGLIRRSASGMSSAAGDTPTHSPAHSPAPARPAFGTPYYRSPQRVASPFLDLPGGSLDFDGTVVPAAVPKSLRAASSEGRGSSEGLVHRAHRSMSSPAPDSSARFKARHASPALHGHHNFQEAEEDDGPILESDAFDVDDTSIGSNPVFLREASGLGPGPGPGAGVGSSPVRQTTPGGSGWTAPMLLQQQQAALFHQQRQQLQRRPLAPSPLTQGAYPGVQPRESQSEGNFAYGNTEFEDASSPGRSTWRHRRTGSDSNMRSRSVGSATRSTGTNLDAWQ